MASTLFSAKVCIPTDSGSAARLMSRLAWFSISCSWHSRFGASADGDKDVARGSKCVHLARENFFETVIVAGRREQASALRKIHRRIWPAIFHKATRQFGAKIGRIRGAAAIATSQDFFPTR